jgi:hypothetical protein
MATRADLYTTLLRGRAADAAQQQRILQYANAEKHRDLQATLARYPQLDPDVSAHLLKVNDVKVRRAWLANPAHTPDQVAAAVGADTRKGVLDAVAVRTGLPQHVYQHVAATGLPSVLWKLLQNPDCGLDAIRIAVTRAGITDTVTEPRRKVLRRLVDTHPHAGDLVIQATRDVQLLNQLYAHTRLSDGTIEHLVTVVLDRLAVWTQPGQTKPAKEDVIAVAWILNHLVKVGPLTTGQARRLAAAAIERNPERTVVTASVTDRLAGRVVTAPETLSTLHNRSLASPTVQALEAARTVTYPDVLAETARRAINTYDWELACAVLENEHVTAEAVTIARNLVPQVPRHVLQAQAARPAVVAQLLLKNGYLKAEDLADVDGPEQVLHAYVLDVLADVEHLYPITPLTRWFTDGSLRDLPLKALAVGSLTGDFEEKLAGLLNRHLTTAPQWELFASLTGDPGMTIGDAIDAAVLVDTVG